MGRGSRVLEHPAYSLAWKRYGLAPPVGSGWQLTLMGYWVCQVSQVAYGHRARKRTWLLYVGNTPPHVLDWSEPEHTGRVGGCANNGVSRHPRVWSREASKTPDEFAKMLIKLAKNSKVKPS